MRNLLQGQGNQVLSESAWMLEKTTGQARASCSTKEHIRAIDGSVPVEEESNLHAGPCQTEMAEIEMAQNALCFAAFPGLAISRQRIDAHTRSSNQILEKPEIKGLRKRAIYGWRLVRKRKKNTTSVTLGHLPEILMVSYHAGVTT